MTKVEKVIDWLNLWVVIALGGVLVFFGAMWFTNGLEEVVRYITSGTITFFILKEVVTRLLK